MGRWSGLVVAVGGRLALAQQPFLILAVKFVVLRVGLLRVLIHEGAQFLFEGHEAFGAEDEALDALLVEDVRGVAAQLNDALVLPFLLRAPEAALLHVGLELVRLHVLLLERLLAALAVERLVIHEVLDPPDNDRVLKFALAHGL